MAWSLVPREKTKGDPHPTVPLPFTNHSQSNFMSPPADLNSDIVGANGMWVVGDSGSGEEVDPMRPSLG